MGASPRARLTWSVFDQALSSLSNYLFLVLLVRSSTLSEVGLYGVAYTTYFLYQSLGRGMASDPLLVRHSPSAHGWREHRAAAFGVVVVLSLAIALGSGVTAAAAGGPWGVAFLALAVAAPGLMVQDTVRMVMFAEGHPRGACVNDGVFLVVQAGLYACLTAVDAVSPGVLMLGWGAAGALAAGVGLVTLRCLPRVDRVRAWWGGNRDLIGPFVGDYVANRGAEQLILVSVAAVGGTPVAGVVTAGRALFAPMTTLQAGVSTFALPDASRRFLAGDLAGLRRVTWLFAGAMVLLMVMFGACLLAVPDSWGRGLFGGNWRPALDVLWPMTFFSAANACAFAIWVGGKAAQQGGAVLSARAWSGLVMLLAAALGAARNGASGAILGMGAGAVVMSVLLGRVLVRVR